jgi:hypothetical protein
MKMAFSNAEKQRKFRERKKILGMRRDWVSTQGIIAASDLAKQRFEACLREKLKDGRDEAKWEFYTWLLEQAKSRPLDASGYASPEYQADRQKLRKRYMYGNENGCPNLF